MALDDEIWDDEEPYDFSSGGSYEEQGIFGDEVRDQIPGYDATTTLFNLNVIGSEDFEFALDMLNYLGGIEPQVGSIILDRAVDIMKNQKLGIGKRDREERITALMDLSHNRGKLTSEGFNEVMRKLDGMNDNEAYLIFARYVTKAAETIGKAAGSPNFANAIETLSTIATRKKLGRVNPIQLLEDTLESRVVGEFTRSEAGARTSYDSLPQDKKELLESAEETDRIMYIGLLGSFPSTRFFPTERFVGTAKEVSEIMKKKGEVADRIHKEFEERRKDSDGRWADSSEYKRRRIESEHKSISGDSIEGYLKNWVGPDASENKARVFMHAYDAFGFDGAVKLGKPAIRAIAKKAKEDGNEWDNGHLQDAMNIMYGAIPEQNNSPPKWMTELHRRISAAQPNEVLQIVNDEVGGMASRQGRLKFLEERKGKFGGLVNKIKRVKPVLDGLHSSDDYITGLDEEIIVAMYEHEGKKAKIMESMGHDLEGINRTYRESGLPARVVIGLYDNGHNNSEILETAHRLPDAKKERLRELDSLISSKPTIWKKGPKLVFSFGTDSRSLEEKIEAIDSMDKVRLDALAIAVEGIDKDPIQYVTALSEENTRLLAGINDLGHDVLCYVDPNNFKDYLDLRDRIRKTDCRDFFDIFCSGKEKGTIKKYATLDSNDRATLFIKYSTVAEAGTVLREFGAEVQGYDQFKSDWKEVSANDSFNLNVRMLEGQLKPFIRVYVTAGDDNRIELVRSMQGALSSMVTGSPEEKVGSLMDLAVKHKDKGANYFTSFTSFISEGVPEERATVFAADEGLRDSYLEVDAAYKPTWLEFAQRIDNPSDLTRMGSSEIRLAAQAYEFAKNAGEERAFYSGFTGTLSQGTTGKWAKTIIDHFRGKAKGGGTYRSIKRTG